MNTKEKILDEALRLFSEKGYGNVPVGQIADAVGIKAPSLYKHYKSKQAIFQAILKMMEEEYKMQAQALKMNGNDAGVDTGIFAEDQEEEVVHKVKGLFTYFLHDEHVYRFRKMLTLEQFHDQELAGLYTEQYVNGPLLYQEFIFSMLGGRGKLKKEDAKIMALHFYAPIYLLLTLCDREPQKEAEAMEMLEAHVRQFQKIYQMK